MELPDHAVKRAQQRGISQHTIALIGALADRRVRVAGDAIAISVSARARARWVRRGLPAADLDRLRTVRIIIDPQLAEIKTVEHANRRRRRR